MAAEPPNTPPASSAVKAQLIGWLSHRYPAALEAARLMFWAAWRMSLRPFQSLILIAVFAGLLYQAWRNWPTDGAWWLAAACVFAGFALAFAIVGFAKARAANAEARHRHEISQMTATIASHRAAIEQLEAGSAGAHAGGAGSLSEIAARTRMAFSTLEARLAGIERAAEARETALRTEILEARRQASDTIASINAGVAALTATLADVQIFQEGRAEHVARVQSELDLLSEAYGKLSGVNEQLSALEQGLANTSSDIETVRVQAENAATKAADMRALMTRMNGANAGAARPFDRLLSADKLARIEQHWLKVFGLTMTRSAIAYLAHQICTAEDRCDGRIAAPIETAVLRQLALRSLPPGPMEILEIGTLFGIGAGALHRFAGPNAERVSLTLIDPLEGYYGVSSVDPTSGVPISRRTLESNLAALNVPREDWRLLPYRSTDPRAITAAFERRYDFVLIDGDHSIDGVARDFDLYGPMVKPGGLLVFDDYANPHWPAIQPFVDEYVRPNPDWIWIGGEFGTGMFRRKPEAMSSQDRAASGEKRAMRVAAQET